LLLASFEHEHEVRIGLSGGKSFVTKYEELVTTLMNNAQVQENGYAERRAYELGDEAYSVGVGATKLLEPERVSRVGRTVVMSAAIVTTALVLTNLWNPLGLGFAIVGGVLLLKGLADTVSGFCEADRRMNVIAYLYGVDSEEYQRANEDKWANHFEMGAHWVAALIGARIGVKIGQAGVAYIRYSSLKSRIIPPYNNGEISQSGHITEHLSYEKLQELYPRSEGYKIYRSKTIKKAGTNKQFEVDFVITKGNEIIHVYEAKTGPKSNPKVPRQINNHLEVLQSGSCEWYDKFGNRDTVLNDMRLSNRVFTNPYDFYRTIGPVGEGHDVAIYSRLFKEEFPVYRSDIHRLKNDLGLRR